MSQWRRKALELFPEHAFVKTEPSVYRLFFTLLLDLQEGYRQVDPPMDYLERIWRFAAWSFEPKRHKSLRGAVAASFYEHLPHFGPARRELSKRLTITDFAELMPFFKVTLSEAELGEFVMEFLTAQGMSRKDARRWYSTAAT